jgi:hypothetical protein
VVRGNLEKEVPEKENSSEQSKLLPRHGHFMIHCQGGEPDIDAIEIRTE